MCTNVAIVGNGGREDSFSGRRIFIMADDMSILKVLRISRLAFKSIFLIVHFIAFSLANRLNKINAILCGMIQKNFLKAKI